MRRQECGSNSMVTVQMTVEEYLEMKSRQDAKEVMSKQKNLVYGLEGIKTLFGCSTTTAWRIKNSEWIRPAISQVGRKIVVDADLALELLVVSVLREQALASGYAKVQPLQGVACRDIYKKSTAFFAVLFCSGTQD